MTEQNDAIRQHINDKCHVDEARPGCGVGEIRHPKHVRGLRPELAVDVIEQARRRFAADRGPHPTCRGRRRQVPCRPSAWPTCSGQPESLSAAAGAAPCTRHKRRGSPRTRAGPPRATRRRAWRAGARGTDRHTGPRARSRVTGDRQHLADRLDPVCPAVLVAEGNHRSNGRSSSAWAKYVHALRRVSLACPSSRFPRSSARDFSATSLGTLARHESLHYGVEDVAAWCRHGGALRISGCGQASCPHPFSLTTRAKVCHPNRRGQFRSGNGQRRMLRGPHGCRGSSRRPSWRGLSGSKRSP